MIEADIVYGYLVDDPLKTLLPVMGHPPTNVSDISLESFMNQILAFNTALTDKSKQKGVKLDFKTIGVFQQSVPLLTKLWPTVQLID